MLPFPIMSVYGNTKPLTKDIRDFYLDPATANSTMIVLLANGEMWGDTYNGQYLGLGTSVNSPQYFGGPYLSLTNVKSMFPCTWGTLAITNDNKVMYTGRAQPFVPADTTTYYNTWQDKTSFYTSVGIDISSIKKICMNSNSAYVLMNNGDLYAHGANSNGQFGLGNTTPISTPTIIKNTVDDIWTGSTNTVYRSAKNFYATGTNSYYQLGNTSSTAQSTWLQIFTTASNNSSFTYNAFRFTDTYFLLYGTGTTFYAQGRNYTGAWGVGSVNIDQNVTSYTGTLPFTPSPNLQSFFGKGNHVYWTNLVISNANTMYIAGTANGGDGTNYYSFTPLTVSGSVDDYRSGTSTRCYGVCNIKTSNIMYGRGSSTTTSSGYGWTPLSTPLKTSWTLINDFNFGS